MSSIYSTTLGTNLMGTGDQSGTWGNTTNLNLGTLLEQAVAGYVTQQFASANIQLSLVNGADAGGNTTAGSIYTTGTTSVPVSARNMYISCTGTTTSVTGNYLCVPANTKLYYVANNTTGGPVIVSYGSAGTPTGTNVSIPVGYAACVICTGANVVQAQNYYSTLGLGNVNVTESTVPANGIYLPSANTFGISSNTTQRATVNSSGQWTFNVPTSGQALTITSYASTEGIRVKSSTANGTAISLIGNSGTGTIYYLSATGPTNLFTINAGSGTDPSSPALSINSASIVSLQTTYITNLTLNGTSVPVNGLYNPSSNALGFATNTTLRATLDSSGNFLVGSTTLPTDLSTNTASVTAGAHKSAAMTTASTASGTAVTIFAIPANPVGVYLIQATLSAVNDAPNYTSVGILVTNAVSYKYTSLVTATRMSISVSGSNLQATQTSGGAAVITATATRFA